MYGGRTYSSVPTRDRIRSNDIFRLISAFAAENEQKYGWGICISVILIGVLRIYILYVRTSILIIRTYGTIIIIYNVQFKKSTIYQGKTGFLARPSFSQLFFIVYCVA